MSESRMIASINAAGEVFRDYSGERVARDVIGRGGSLADFYRGLAPHVGSADADLDKRSGTALTEREVREFSIGRMARTLLQVRAAHAMEMPDQFDRNMADARAQLAAERGASCFEIEAARGRIPWSVLTRDFNTAQASAVIPTGLGTNYTGDALRAALPLARLGAQLVARPPSSGAFKVPVVTGDVNNVDFLGEVESATDGEPTTGLVDFAPRRVSSCLDVSRQALMQGGPVLDDLLARVIFGKVRASIEDGGINGDGIGDNPTGIRATTGTNTVVGGVDGAAFNWGHLTDLEYSCAIDNVPELATGYLVNPATRRYLKRTQRASGLPFMWGEGARPLGDHPAAVTQLVPSDLTKGSSAGVCSSVIFSADWRMLMIVTFGGPELLVDQYTRSREAVVRLIFNTYVAPGILHPAAFSVMDDALLS